MTETYDPKKLDHYKYVEQDATWIQKFLWGCAGADRQLLMQSPHSDRVKEEGIGGVVLATAVLAFFSGSYAFYTIFKDKGVDGTDVVAMISSVLAGIVWALIIFNLDRFIVSTAGTGDGTDSISWSELAKALPRLTMALFIGFTLSKPLELRILQSELDGAIQAQISEKLAVIQSDGYKSNPELKKAHENLELQKEELERAKASLKDAEAKRKTKDENINRSEANIADEVAGKMGRPGGVGPHAREMLANIERAKLQLADATAEAEKAGEQLKQATKSKQDAEDKLADLEKELKKQIARETDGLWARIHKAHEVAFAMTWILSALFICIEITPVLLKMMLPIGPYNYLKENQKKMALARCGIETDVLNLPLHPSNTEPQDAAGVIPRLWQWLAGDRKASTVASHDMTLMARYHRADTILNYERGQMRVEQELTRQEQEKIAPGAFGKPAPTQL